MAMTFEGRGVTVVAGGAGLIGSHLCAALLTDGAEVICVDNFLTGRRENIARLLRHKRFSVVRADITEPLPKELSAARLRGGAIFNLACAASPPHYQADPEHTMLTCIVGTCNLLRLAEAAGARFLQASTSEVYGDPEVHPQREDYWGHVNQTGPRGCYDEGKRAAETLVFDFERAGRADVRVARIFNTYGPRMRADDGRVVSNVVTQALAGGDITIYGDGLQTRSFCYVDDLVDGLRKLMACDADPKGAVNLGNPAEITVAALVGKVLAMTGSQSRIAYRPLPTDDPRRRRPDIGRARTLLGWEPRVPLSEGLATTIAWFARTRSESACKQRARADKRLEGARVPRALQANRHHEITMPATRVPPPR